MKYGVEIDRRSVPEWRAHNIDYNEIKQLIKKATQDDRSESSKQKLFKKLYENLCEEFTSVDLFVKLKSGEIDRRIHDCEKIVEALAEKEQDSTSSSTGENLQSKASQSRLFRLHQEISTLTKDIQSLSRFVGVQRTGFFKLLKKYKKWSGSDQLSEMFMPILEAPDSFVFEDFTSKFLELSLLYSVLRYPKFTSIKQKFSVTFPKESYNKFDCDMVTSLNNSEIFWVHPDNIVELSVALLKNLVLYNVNDSQLKDPQLKRSLSNVLIKHSQSFTGLSLASASGGDPTVQNGSSEETANGNNNNNNTGGSTGFAHVMYLDDSKFKSAKTGKEPGQIRWTDSELYPQQEGPKRVLCAPVGGLRYFSTVSINQDDYSKICNNNVGEISVDNTDHSANLALGWLKNRNASPVSEISCDRTRFVNPNEDATSTDSSSSAVNGQSKIWAALDSSITIRNLRGSTSGASVEHFPYSVLEIRWTGSSKPAFVKELANSHLVQRMQGFSLYAHSVALFNSSVLESSPFWMTILRDKVDIRKAPKAVRPALSKRESTVSSMKNSTNGSKYSKQSQGNVNGGTLTPGILLNDGRSSGMGSEDSSATEPMTPRKLLMSRSSGSLKQYSKSNEQRTLDVRYWNEFDNPEDGEGDFGVFLIPEEDDKDGILSDSNIEAIIDFSSKVITRLTKIKKAFSKHLPTYSDNERVHLLAGSDDDEDDDDDDGADTTGLSSGGSFSGSRRFSNYSPRFKPRRNTGLDDHDYESFNDELSEPRYGSSEERRNRVLTILYTMCFAFSSLITAVMFGIILGEDMSEVSVGTFAFTICGFTISLAIGILGMCFFTLREVHGWAHQTVVFATFFSIVCFSVGGICWILSV